ncbi:gamma-interferon-inducible lysosomal thiol reductase-like [Haemaphysalis longicornis]
MVANTLRHGSGLFGMFIVTLQLCSPVVGKNVNLTVYYEGLCPDCYDFMLHQLLPTYTKLEDHINLDLLPFGKAHMKVSNGTITFQCQHGPGECYVNKVQTCAVKYVHPTRKLVTFVVCMFSQEHPVKAGPKCAQKAETDWGVLDRCSRGPEGIQLLSEMGKRTLGHKPDINFVPYVDVNGFHNETVQDLAMQDLFRLTCEFLEPQPPRVCKRSGGAGRCSGSNPTLAVRY